MSKEYFEALDMLEFWDSFVQGKSVTKEHFEGIVAKHKDDYPEAILPWLRLCHWITMLAPGVANLTGVTVIGKGSNKTFESTNNYDCQNHVVRMRTVVQRAEKDDRLSELGGFLSANNTGSSLNVQYERGVGDILSLITPHGKIRCGIINDN